jgi:TnpA family transposase
VSILHEEALRPEIHEGLNVIDQWTGAKYFVFFARRGELASNRTEDHELEYVGAAPPAETAWFILTPS